jgi:hypothetical protein
MALTGGRERKQDLRRQTPRLALGSAQYSARFQGRLHFHDFLTGRHVGNNDWNVADVSKSRSTSGPQMLRRRREM